MTNEELVARLQKESEPALLEQLYQQNQGIICKVAIKFASDHVSMEDLMQQSFLILYDAVASYDLNGGALFASYYGSALEWKLRRYVVECEYNVRLPMGRYHDMAVVRRCREDFRQEYRRNPTLPEIAKRTGLSLKRITVIMKSLLMLSPVSMDSPILDDGAEDFTISDLIPSPSAEQDFTRIDNKMLWSAVNNLLIPSQANVIRKYFIDGETFAQIGDELGISRQRTHQLYQAGMKKLRQSLRKQL